MSFKQNLGSCDDKPAPKTFNLKFVYVVGNVQVATNEKQGMLLLYLLIGLKITCKEHMMSFKSFTK